MMFYKYIFLCELNSVYYIYMVSCYIAAGPHRCVRTDAYPSAQCSKTCKWAFPTQNVGTEFPTNSGSQHQGWGLWWDCVYLSLSFAQCEIVQPVSMFFFPPPREHCFIYSCEFGMFLGGQHPVASPPATRTCLYFYAYFNAEFSMCVFIWFFYVLNSTLHKGIRCCVKNN